MAYFHYPLYSFSYELPELIEILYYGKLICLILYFCVLIFWGFAGVFNSKLTHDKKIGNNLNTWAVFLSFIFLMATIVLKELHDKILI